MDSKFLRAEELGIRLEIVSGLPIWEPYPIYKHQKAVDRIRSTIENVSTSSEPDEPACACVHAADVYVSFPRWFVEASRHLRLLSRAGR